jgi:RHS repeat-associated protein
MTKEVLNGGLSGTVPNGRIEFYYDGWRVVEERDGTDQPTQQYTYGNYLDEVWTLDKRTSGITVAQLNDATGSERLFYHCNTLYSVFGLSNETGSLVEGYQYDAYGKATVFTGQGVDATWFTNDDVQNTTSYVYNPYTYTGQRLDAESGWMYYKNRYYSPDLGRFVSRWTDFFFDLNLYQYQFANPVYYTDPYGDPDPTDIIINILIEWLRTQPEWQNSVGRSTEAGKEGARTQRRGWATRYGKKLADRCPQEVVTKLEEAAGKKLSVDTIRRYIVRSYQSRMNTYLAGYFLRGMASRLPRSAIRSARWNY